jgi:hypothetical protein
MQEGVTILVELRDLRASGDGNALHAYFPIEKDSGR